MGDPWFKLAPRAKEWGLVALSSNYELYGDISAYVINPAGPYSAWLEVYSSTRPSSASKAPQPSWPRWAGP